MRILLLTNNLKGGDGWSSYALSLGRALERMGHDVLCLTAKRSESELRELSVLKEPYRYLANPLVSRITARAIRGVLADFRPDAMHIVAEPYSTVLPYLNTRQMNVLVTIHGTYAYFPALLENKLKRVFSERLFARAHKKIDKVIAVSNFTKDRFLNSFKDKNTRALFDIKTTVITNGVDAERFRQVSRKPTYGATKHILFVGEVKARKGLREALLALASYRNAFSDDFIFEIVGRYDAEGGYHKSLRDVIREHKLEQNVFFRGPVLPQELSSYYRKADLFLMLPPGTGVNFEGFGLVYLEAASAGVPCIGSEESSAREAIIHGTTGYLADTRSPKDIALKINRVLSKSAIRPDECKKWAKENDIARKAEQIAAYYKVQAHA